MSEMVRSAARSALASRGGFLLTGTAIALSVAFLAATLVLSDSMRGRAASDIAEALAGTDAVVQGVEVGEPGGGPGDPARSVQRSLDPDITERVVAVDGVDAAASQWVGFAKLVVDGSSVGAGTASDVGRNWVADPALNPFRLASGQAPTEVGQIAIDRSLARDADLAPGDTVQVLTATGMHDATITGVATFASADAAPLQRTVLFPDGAVPAWLDPAAPTQVLVELAQDADRAEVLGRLSALSDGQVVDGPDHIRTMQVAATSPLEFLNVFLLAFAVVAVLIGVTIIFNTFALVVARRRRESGLLRAIGAERRQVLGGVVIEAALVGTVATLVGLALGVAGVGALRWVVGLTGVTLLTGPSIVSATSIAIAATVGIGTTILSAWIPARRAAATPPIEALRESAAEPRRVSPVRTASGLVLAAVAAVGGAVAVVGSNPAWLGLVAAVVPALVLCGPAIVTASAHLSAPVARRVAGVRGAIAAGNLAASPRRSASTALALILGTAMVTLFAVFASSLTSGVGTDVREGLQADLVVTSATPDVSTIDPTLAGRVAALPGVDAVATLAKAEGIVAGAAESIGGIDPTTLAAVFDLDLVAGDLTDLRSGGVAVVGDDPTLLGGTLQIEFGRSTIDAPIVAVVARSTGGFEAPLYFVDDATLEASAGRMLDALVFVDLADGAGADVEDAVRSLVRGAPGAFFETRAEHVAGSGSEIAAFGSFIDGMLILASVIALLGVANTTALAVRERSGEIGLLRAVGTTRQELRGIVRLEMGLLSLVAASIGIVVAVGFGWALIDLTGGTEIPSVVVPWTRLVVTFVVAVAAGVLAAAWPAFRVSRVPVLELVARGR
ncbi:FtsX-like permease family protein [Cellulomonas phragmiteti]|uniref:ABC transporter substrate-binding protein n=1 Tax=Cellulomonas phragmiteti TaxID=478780 RepID=A0ABQ4DJ14_9CELL|nr:FtsX-like permease family protein [Cellulomonas phragmiteti]GIG39342.1 ABC transporter substrate-binding protein [Cellulomonas phragmiteti]